MDGVQIKGTREVGCGAWTHPARACPGVSEEYAGIEGVGVWNVGVGLEDVGEEPRQRRGWCRRSAIWGTWGEVWALYVVPGGP